MSSGPLPTRLIFLDDLRHTALGEKVRFLGWYYVSIRPHHLSHVPLTLGLSVSDYSAATGTLTLQHAYPPPPYTTPSAFVDVRLLLETLKTTDTEIGEWVNVVGYVERDETVRRDRDGGRKLDWIGTVRVQAIMLWSAGGVKLKDYEEAVQKRKDYAVRSQ